MALDKQSILESTTGGYDVFKHFLGSRIQGTGKAFKSPFYDDTKAACYVYFDKRSRVYKFKDFGNAEYSGDCFFFVGKIFALACEHSQEFLRIMEIIDQELGLGLESNTQKVERVIRDKGEQVIKASKLPSIHGRAPHRAEQPSIQRIDSRSAVGAGAAWPLGTRSP